MIANGQVPGMPNQRRRLAVLPGLPASGSSMSNYSAGQGRISPPLPEPDKNKNRQLVPLNVGLSKPRGTWNHLSNSDFRANSSGEDGRVNNNQLHNFVNRISTIEEGNKALLEEIYRLQSAVRSTQSENKGKKAEEKKWQHELIEMIRTSNDVVSELTSRMRLAEDKIHIDKETRKNLLAQTKQFEKVLINSQQEIGTQRDNQKTQYTDLRHKLEEIGRKYERSERASSSLIDEFRQMKTKLDMQALDFAHLQTEVRQRSKRVEEETKQALLETRFQKESSSQADHSILQTRQFFEARLNELRDSIADMRNHVGRVESESHGQTQQITIRLSELQSYMSDHSHKRQEDIQTIEQHRNELTVLEENARMKLQTKLQEAIKEMSDKILNKEVKLREEALRKFVEVEKILQREESIRLDFEKKMREESEVRWNMQQKVLIDELHAIKEVGKTEKSKREADTKRLNEALHTMDKKVLREKKSLEKVILAEITKRETQSSETNSHISAVQEQLRVALSSLQQAIGGVQFQVSKDKEQFTNEVKTKISEEQQRVTRAIADVDTRLTSLGSRISQQDDTHEAKLTELASSFRDEQRELMHNTEQYQQNVNNDILIMQEVLKELPQKVREVEERIGTLKDDVEMQKELENEARRKDADAMNRKIMMLAQRLETLDTMTNVDHTRIDEQRQQLATALGTLNQMSHEITDLRTVCNVRLNSETKMRLEESSAIKRELARLRTDIQPLLWKQSADSRRFVKRGPVALNDWGVYQCARWHDIKKRWLRLLGRRTIRNQRQRVSLSQSPQPSTSGQSILSDIHKMVAQSYTSFLLSPSGDNRSLNSQPANSPDVFGQENEQSPEALSREQSNIGNRKSNLDPSDLHAETGETPVDNDGLSYGDEESEILNFDEDDNDEMRESAMNKSNEGTPVNTNSRVRSQPPSAEPESNVAPSPSARRTPKTWADPSARRPSQGPSPRLPRTGSIQSVKQGRSAQITPNQLQSAGNGSRRAPSGGSVGMDRQTSRGQSGGGKQKTSPVADAGHTANGEE